MRRKRKHIPLAEQLAAALACLLPQEQRDALRAAKVPAVSIRSLFEMDHVVLHAHDGSDAWWNIHPSLKEPHREKSRRDTAIVAKVKRLRSQYDDQATKSPVGLIEFMVAVDRIKAEDEMARHLHRKPTHKLWGASRSQPRVKRKIAQRPPGASWPPKGSRPLRRSNTRMES